ncbi:MAG: serine/threonine-protein kinase [Labilithrix sp.]
MASDWVPQRCAGGRLTLHEPIGVGGMATVHLARLRTESGERTVAVKRPHARATADPSFVAMLLDEARLMLRIRHPNVVPTLEVLIEPSDVLLVMDYAHGESLAGVLATPSVGAEGVPVPIAVAILVDVARGLHAAHETRDDEGELLGIVHRDVSPQNILVGADGHSRVLDFGVAKAAGRLQTTRTGQLKGKIRYTAPEAFRGEVDRRADVYALAAVFWELLTGSRLVAAEGDGAAVRQILFEDPPPPSSVRSTLPRAIDAIAARGLARSPDDRYPSVRAFAEAIEAIAPAAPREHVAAWLARHVGAKLASRMAVVDAIERAPAPRGRGAVIVAVTAAATIALGVALLLGVGRPAKSAVRDEAPSRPPPAAEPAPSASVAAAVTPSAEPAASDAVLASTSSASPPVLAKTSPPKRPARTTPAAPPKRVDTNCDPPYDLDARGFRQFKPECVGAR